MLEFTVADDTDVEAFVDTVGQFFADGCEAVPVAMVDGYESIDNWAGSVL